MCCTMGIFARKAWQKYADEEWKKRFTFAKASTLPHFFRRRIKAETANPPKRVKDQAQE